MNETKTFYPACPNCGSRDATIWSVSNQTLTWFTCNKYGVTYSDGPTLNTGIAMAPSSEFRNKGEDEDD